MSKLEAKPILRESHLDNSGRHDIQGWFGEYRESGLTLVPSPVKRRVNRTLDADVESLEIETRVKEPGTFIIKFECDGFDGTNPNSPGTGAGRDGVRESRVGDTLHISVSMQVLVASWM